MNLKTALFLIVTAAVLSALVAFLLYNYESHSMPPNTKTLPYRFSVAEYPGVDVGTDVFRLGAVTPGASSYRQLHITDPLASDNRTRQVLVSARGAGSQWLRIEPANGTMPLDVTITAMVPVDAPLGTYDGLLLVTITTE